MLITLCVIIIVPCYRGLGSSPPRALQSRIRRCFLRRYRAHLVVISLSSSTGLAFTGAVISVQARFIPCSRRGAQCPIIPERPASILPVYARPLFLIASPPRFQHVTSVCSLAGSCGACFCTFCIILSADYIWRHLL